MTEPLALRAHYRARKAVLLQSLATGGKPGGGVRALLGKLSTLADDTLRTLWQQAGLGSPLALVGVGGFGRAELFPGSDIDVLLLLPNDQSAQQDEGLKACLEAFIGSCWDAGLEIGSSVRTVQECLQESARDVTVQTSLLEARLITGNPALFASFQQQYFAALDPRAFFVAKTP
jgi:[protein-PII] uridylyltransferase